MKIENYPKWQKIYVDGVKQVPVGLQLLYLGIVIVTFYLVGLL